MYARPWHDVIDFYSKLVSGNVSLSQLFGTKTCVVCDDSKMQRDYSEVRELENVSSKDRLGRWARVTFKIVLSYHGDSFDGWQKQPGLNTVQGLVEKYLGSFVDDKKAQQLKDKCKPLEGCAVVAGRTDKGVSALQQVCSFYTWRKDIKPCDIEDAINTAAPGKLRVLSVSEVSRVFHPNFSAKWRRYLYIFPLNDGEECCENEKAVVNFGSDKNQVEQIDECDKHMGEKNIEDLIISDDAELEAGEKPKSFNVSRVDQLLRKLEGKLLSYKMFARDTKPSRNVGPATECFIYHARATEAILPCSDNEGEIKVMCVELVANRFLRKMVRVLVATSIREAAAGAEDDALLNLMDATCRRATAPPAPPDGLCLVDVGYSEFDQQECFIN